MPHAYTEDQHAQRTFTQPPPTGAQVEQPAIGLFAEQIASPYPHPRSFSHWEKGARQAGLRVCGLVALESRLRAALDQLNPALPPEAITAAVGEWTRDRSAMSLFSGQVNLKMN